VRTRETRPDDVLSSSSRGNCRTLISAAVYDGALERVGGRPIEVRSSVRSSELLVALYESPPFDLKVPPMDVARLSINLAGVPVFGAIASARNGNYKGRRYSLFYTPAGCDAHWSKPRHSRHLNIYIKEDLIEELSEGRTALLSHDRPLLDVRVRGIKQWIDALEVSIGEPGPFADDASLGLAHLIIAKLTRDPGKRTPTLKTVALARVQDYVAEYLSEPIRVADLAALTGMSVGRFTLCFRASTGASPHRFVISRRVEAAMGLLRESSMPMAEVAAVCGFSSQQHMATMMRRLMRVAPSAVRRRDWSGSACPAGEGA
jgi:AraC family transcriptional regulator